MMNSLDIDNEILISLVQERPVLWDKTLDIFKDRDATRNAWHEVCLGIRSDFEVLGEKERNDFGKEVMKRWKHLRDAFAKAEKKAKESKASGSGAVKKRKYIFNDELQFLKKIYEKTETTESFITEDENKDETDGCWQQPSQNTEEHGISPTTRTMDTLLSNTQPRRKYKKIDEVDLKILKALEKTENEKPNSQMSFFHSLLPHTESFDNNQWLQFQMEVLRAISTITSQKIATLPSQVNNTKSASQSQQQSQSTPSHPQSQTFPQSLQRLYILPRTWHNSQSSHLPLYDPPLIPSVSSQNTLPTSPFKPMKNIINNTVAGEHYQHFAKSVNEEDHDSRSSVYSRNSTEVSF